MLTVSLPIYQYYLFGYMPFILNYDRLVNRFMLTKNDLCVDVYTLHTKIVCYNTFQNYNYQNAEKTIKFFYTI